MSKQVLTILALSAVLGFRAPALLADHGDQGHKNGHGDKHSDDEDDQGWQHRDGYEYRTYAGRDSRPPGWTRGKKTGWKDCGLPPDQAKKYGCYVYTYEGRPHYYYQDEEEQIIVRRPIIEIHGSVDISR